MINIHFSEVLLQSSVDTNPPNRPFKVSHSENFLPDLLLMQPRRHHGHKIQKSTLTAPPFNAPVNLFAQQLNKGCLTANSAGAD